MNVVLMSVKVKQYKIYSIKQYTMLHETNRKSPRNYN